MSDTHHAIIDFDGEHDSIYISVSKTPTANEEIKQLVEAEKVEQEWLVAHPLLAAELELSKAQEQFAEIDKSYQEKQNYLNQLLSSPEGLTLTDPDKYPLIYQQTESQLNLTKVEIKINDRNSINTLFQKGVKNFIAEKALNEIQKNPAIAAGVITISAFYERLGITLVDTHQKIEKTKTELAPIVESRKKAEDKKKEAEEKVAKESKRDKPGTVTGDGQEVGDNWLTGVGEGDGDPIPKSVADELKGKEFSSFDKLRKAIWTSIGKKQKLTQNIKSKSNKKQVSKGKSPFAFKKDRVGGRKRLEMHHVEEIQHGGPVYNLDNLRIVTPKNHIRIHSKK
nr:colicin-like bacteriocin tRNase domain-containing protein [Xenorhabdus bovienii]